MSFGIAAIYHMLAITAPSLNVTGTPWRHALFVVINALSVWLILRRGRWSVLFFSLITVEQLFSHGTQTWNRWHIEHRIDWISIGVVIVLFLTVTLLLLDAKEKRLSPTK